MRSIDPHDGRLITTWDPLRPDQLRTRVEVAALRFASWRRQPLARRTEHLRKLAAGLRLREGYLAELMTREVGKPITESEGEVRKCAWVCEHYAEHAAEFLAPRPVDVGDDEASVRFDPLGVVLAVMPWNFPLWQVLRFGAPALAAGNVMLIKHAPNTMGCGLAIEEVAREAGLPEGCLTNLLVGVEHVAELIAHPAVAAVTLTGSDRAGRAVGALAGKALKKSVLELGGSDPFIVLADADVEAAVAAGVRSRALNSGQSCIAAKRFFVEEPVAEEFTKRFVEAMSGLVVGDPRDRATQVGPLARDDLRAALHDQVRRSVEAGANLLCGGEVPAGPGFYYPPTVLDRVAPGMPAFDEETFGPVAAITVVGDEDEAVALSNRSDLGLGASVFTADLDRARRMAERLEAGCVFVNRMTASDPRVPFGGVKGSGYGRELGVFGIREFVNVKTVWVHAPG